MSDWFDYSICPHCKLSQCNCTSTEQRVMTDILERARVGLKKYGVSVQDNPLTEQEWLQHAYEECLDQAVYLRRLLDSIDGRGKGHHGTIIKSEGAEHSIAHRPMRSGGNLLRGNGVTMKPIRDQIADPDQLSRFFHDSDVVIGWKDTCEVLVNFGSNTELNRRLADLMLRAIKSEGE